MSEVLIVDKTIPQKPKSRKKLKVFGAIGLMLFLGVQTVSYAQLPVHDEINRVITVLGFKNELDQLVTQYNYAVEMNGHWADQLNITKNLEALAATLGIPIDKLGWANRGKFNTEKATEVVANALDELEKVQQGKANQAELGKMEQDLELVYQAAPVTTDGARSEMALREMANAKAFIGQNNKAIQENLDNIQRLKSSIDSGELVPGDLDRIRTELAAEQLKLQANQAQGNNQLLRVQSAQLGLQTAQATDEVNNRLRDRYDRLEVAKRLIMLNPAIKKQSPVVAAVE